MNIIEQCARAVWSVRQDHAQKLDIKLEDFDCTDYGLPNSAAINGVYDELQAVLKTLAARLDEEAVEAALAPDGFLPERETREAITAYLAKLSQQGRE